MTVPILDLPYLKALTVGNEPSTVLKVCDDVERASLLEVWALVGVSAASRSPSIRSICAAVSPTCFR
jgi:hypothetical protein